MERTPMANDVIWTVSWSYFDLVLKIKRINQQIPTRHSFSDDIMTKLDQVLQQWSEFTEKLDALTQWFRTVEPIFKDEQLQATLEQKQSQLEKFTEQRGQIEGKEKDVDSFMDRSHCLLHQSGVDRIKPLISQISNR